jgi:NAD(P)-dependent dehydrogenase (short-subunit alcohol dehydrogenase family)
MKLLDKVAIITGAGRGIGKTICLAFAKEGASVAIVSRTRSEIEATAEAAKDFGNGVLWRAIDISNKLKVRDLIYDTVERFGHVDILVNNAGIITPIGPFVGNDTGSWAQTINVNLMGTYFCTKYTLPYMIEQKDGKIINVLGGGATSPYPMFSAYATSKAAIAGLTQTLAEEVREHNIQVNAITPGVVYTKLQDDILAAGIKSGQKSLSRAKAAKEKGLKPAEEAAELAIFLGSRESGKLTGRIISAVWDDWRSLSNRQKQRKLIANDLFTLRRIDGMFFVPKGAN